MTRVRGDEDEAPDRKCWSSNTIDPLLSKTCSVSLIPRGPLSVPSAAWRCALTANCFSARQCDALHSCSRALAAKLSGFRECAALPHR